MYTGTRLTTSIHRRLFSRFFLKEGDVCTQAKSEALDKIKSLFKQNIKSGNAKRRRQRRRTVKDNNRSNLPVQHTFFVHFFAVVLHNYNVKLAETS